MCGEPNVTVLEKAWIGSGNVSRNTTIIRSNYLLPGNGPFYELSLKLWESLVQDFNYNAMVSQRGVINLFYSDTQRDTFVRRGNVMLLAVADAVLLDQDSLRQECSFLDSDNARFPILDGLLQPHGSTVRHDAVAWGYVRGADQLGVDIIENCEDTGFEVEGGVCSGVETRRGRIGPRDAAEFVCLGDASLIDRPDMQAYEAHQPGNSEAGQMVVSGVASGCTVGLRLGGTAAYDRIVFSNAAHAINVQRDE
ncbi:MAG: FAD-dependent oxidoreductase [Rhodospirillaceae bacterium]